MKLARLPRPLTPNTRKMDSYVEKQIAFAAMNPEICAKQISIDNKLTPDISIEADHIPDHGGANQPGQECAQARPAELD